MSSGSAGFFNTPVIGPFVDTLRFTLTSASFASGSITSAVSGNQDVDFTSIVISRVGSSSVNFSLLIPDPFEVWALPAAGATLAVGTYTLTLTGISSVAGCPYGGNFAVAVVPEPATLALMLAGLGVVGFIARSRKF